MILAELWPTCEMQAVQRQVFLEAQFSRFGERIIVMV